MVEYDPHDVSSLYRAQRRARRRNRSIWALLIGFLLIEFVVMGWAGWRFGGWVLESIK